MAIFDTSTSPSSKIFKTGQATFSFDGVNTSNADPTGPESAIFLGFTITVQRQLQPIPTMTNGLVWAAQPAQGTLEAQSIVVSTTSTTIIEKLTNEKECAPVTITIDLDDACDGASKIDIKDAYCSQVVFQGSGQQGYVANNFTCQFTQCEFT